MNMEHDTNVVSRETADQSSQPNVRENVAGELRRLRDDLWRIAEDVRMKAKGASAEVESTRRALEREVERFSDEVKDAAENTRGDLKEVGEDLRTRFRKLANQIVMPAS